MRIHQNTLYVLSQKSYIHRENLTLQVQVERETKLAVPIHHLDSLAVFGNVMVSPGAMELCAEKGVAVTFLSQNGRLFARVDAPQSGNVLLRREQFRKADREEEKVRLARFFIAGKLQNSRSVLLRGARETASVDDRAELEGAAAAIAACLTRLETLETLDEVRGQEGEGARRYFGAFNRLLKRQREAFQIRDRNRRPPLDPTNALLSFSYALLLHDCISALTAAGLDSSVGFLHADRPGRPALALDLMEEFRPLLADRLALTLINRQEVRPGGFLKRDGGAVEMDDLTRRAVVTAYQARKQEEVVHPFLEQKATMGLMPHLQAKLLARYLRGDIAAYPVCVLK
ncbi:MAG: type I-C CRISPR-associated endonuclease Cas1 [Elusimicrobia bacterium]|nr:type I-C CRISPR-associated endonuclease Cas1 [Elusimicrobiota bacterium]